MRAKHAESVFWPDLDAQTARGNRGGEYSGSNLPKI